MITKEVLELIQQGKTNELVKLGSIVVEPMILLLSDSGIEVRNGCIEALAEIAKTDENTLKLLIQTLKNNLDPNVKFHCAKALGQIEDPKAISALIFMMEYGGCNLSEVCLDILVKLARRNKDVVDQLIIEFENPPPIIIRGYGCCAEALGEIGDKKATAVLFNGLRNYFMIRELCANALAKIAERDEETFELLVEGLNDSTLFVRKACAGALGKIKDKRAVDPLIRGLQDPEPEFKQACANALENINDQRGVHFKRIIHDRFYDIIPGSAQHYALKIGMQKTLEIIREYLELIKKDYPKGEIKEIRVSLFDFYRKAFEKSSAHRVRLELPELKIKPPKRGPEICARLMRIGL
ncbi:MAG: HEAT repeat domain-containing protein [Candidatus Micrarchaeia archaeon]